VKGTTKMSSVIIISGQGKPKMSLFPIISMQKKRNIIHHYTYATNKQICLLSPSKEGMDNKYVYSRHQVSETNNPKYD